MTLPAPNGNGIRISGTTLHRIGWHIGQLIITIFLAGAVWAKLDSKVDENNKAIADIASYQRDIDKNGTRRSHEIDTNQQTQIDELTRRTTNLEGIMRDLIPKVERTETKVLSMSEKDKYK